MPEYMQLSSCYMMCYITYNKMGAFGQLLGYYGYY